MNTATKQVISLDTETHLIGPCNVAPKMVCATFGQGEPEAVQTDIMASCDPELPVVLWTLLEEPETDLVGHNMAYDMGVIASTFPELIPLIFKAYNEGRIHCTKIREKLINLSTMGGVDWQETPDGGKVPLKYSLKDLVRHYFDIDISESKDAPDAWRLNYHLLDGKPISEYPDEAKSYAMDDSKYTLEIFYRQEARAAEGVSLETEAFQAAADFALFLTTCHGIAIDEEYRKGIEAMLAQELAPEKTALLVEHGILDPGEPPRPHVKNPEKMTAGKKPSIKQKVLGDYVRQVCEHFGIEVKMTNGREDKTTGERTPGVCCDAEVMDNIAHLDPVLTQYQHRQSLQKLVTTDLPRIQAPIVHFPYDVLKETGRTSSRASDLFPSANGQNIDPRVKPCFVPRDGWLLLSVDYASIELVTAAQKQYELFGSSVLGDIINKGWDPHAYLGGQMAYNFDENFRGACEKANCTNKDEVYFVFMSMKKDEREDVRAFFKLYRTFAKPTGLGYPGGLGAETFVTYAKATYGVVITIEQAVNFKNIWLDTFPEFKLGFAWIESSCKDPNDPQNYFAYTTPLGMVRTRVSYCAAANGAFLQSPAAEGGKLAFYTFVEACYTLTEKHPALYGCRPLGWIHDEILCEIPDDEFSHERSLEVSAIMVECMGQITPNVQVRTEPKLMRRWYKEAEPVYVDGRLVPWAPKNDNQQGQ